MNYSILTDKVKELERELEKISETKNKKINIFDAIGMHRQEIKHSAFFAWILNPKAPHGFFNKSLKVFLQILINYNNTNAKTAGFPSNKQILNKYIFNDFLSEDDIIVETETALTKEYIDDGRIDIFIESKKSKTLIIIENKVFTTTHDNQLNRYRQEFEDRNDWKKVFIYLSPKGELPRDDCGALCNDWCVLDYKAVLDVVRILNKECGKSKEQLKLRNLLEDYIDMVESEILKERNDLIKICKKIRREYKEALDILWQYTGEKPIDFCKTWIKNNIDGVNNIQEGSNSMRFRTNNIETYFLKTDSNKPLKIDENRYRFSYGFSCKDGPLRIGVSMEKDKNEAICLAQKEIKNIIAPNKYFGDKYCSLYGKELLTEEELYADFNEIQTKLENGLKEFQNIILNLESKLI